ncbi:hypothetical protein NMY3_02053 [Candidatus Nitrosocosmicus oleophilus]|uniref:Uncharacterized protein n=1 Tax=Candidatus Nitrosocosmicus oleophilus TaxID=1353260 RepID=A0A654LXM1_9ARCH|nr:hypothetical protein NMY3_02053 [Candidatus Nitrosocosmicus oleophilus]
MGIKIVKMIVSLMTPRSSNVISKARLMNYAAQDNTF